MLEPAGLTRDDYILLQTPGYDVCAGGRHSLFSMAGLFLRLPSIASGEVTYMWQ